MNFRHSPVFQFRNGDHTCVFYSSVEELLGTLTPFIAEGLRRGERCFCVQKPEVLKRLTYDLMYLGIDPDTESRRGSLELHTEEEVYLSNGHFEPQEMMDMLIASITRARVQGFTSFRSAGELSWAVEGRNECDRVIGYEKLVDEYYPGKPAIGLCQYPLPRFAPKVLQSVLEAHRLQLGEAAANSAFASMHIRNRHWSAEMVADKMAANPRFYYVVQQRLSPREIMGWGIAPDFDTATASIDRLGLRREAGSRLISN